MDANRIARLLPETYRSAIAPGEPLAALVETMQALHAPSEAVLQRIDDYVHPLRAPDDFALMLASWLDLDRYLDWTGDHKGAGQAQYAAGLGNLRVLATMAAHLMRWRGTRYGLERFLVAATGIPGFDVEENPPGPDGEPIPFHIRVRAPKAARRLEDLVHRIVDAERPAYVTYDIEFASGGDPMPPQPT
ncbi:MAG: hypothetical protein P8Z81_02770 [Deinococcales bacterium]|jgi:phage tail-like protein